VGDTATESPLVSAASALGARAAAEAERAEAAGLLGADLVAAIRKAGFLQYFTPPRQGAGESTFTELLRAVTCLGEGDASAAWCASLAAYAGRVATFLPDAGQERLWRDGGDVFIVVALRTSGAGRLADGGWNVSGEWRYISGVDFSDWALLSCPVACADGRTRQRFVLLPRSAYRVEKTWFGVGMRATGSHTLVVDNAFVPESSSFHRDDLLTGQDHSLMPLRAVPHAAVSGLALGAPVLGAAKAALNAWVTSAYRPGHSRATGSQDDLVLARAAAEIDAAELLLERTAAAADTRTPSTLEAVRAHRDHALASELLVAAVDRVFRAAGAAGTSETGPIARRWRDIHAACVHPGLRLETTAKPFADLVMTTQLGHLRGLRP
jgi:two-component flavin-dependent monooxygenase